MLMLQYNIPVAKRESIHSSGGCDSQLSDWWQRNACTMALLGQERGDWGATVMAGW